MHGDDAFRVAANQQPDHSTIARFRVRHEMALRELFTQVLPLCHTAGLVRVGVLALDGTKLSAPASLNTNRTREQLEAQVAAILAEAAATDAGEDAADDGDRDPPAVLRGWASRRARLAECKASPQ